MSEPNHHLTPGDEADLAALADGRLDPERRRMLEARIEAEPSLGAALERQRSAVQVLFEVSGSVSAPLRLRTAVERMSEEPPAARRASLWAPRRWLPVAAIGGAVAVAILLAGAGGPGVPDVVAAAAKPPQERADAGTPGDRWLAEAQDGLRFPEYADWRADGTRDDRIGGPGRGRQTRTVFYAGANGRVAYSIVSGDALEEPDDARVIRRGNQDLRTFEDDGRTVVTWVRNGHTCVLSSRDLPADRLAALAVWS